MTKGLNLLQKTAFLLVFTFLIVLSTYSSVGDTTKVRAHDNIDMTWYGNYDAWGEFPDGSATYGKVLMHYTMGCASTGCSPWDYTTQIFLLHNTGEIDSTLEEDPYFTVNGSEQDSLYYNVDTSYKYIYDSISQNTDSVLLDSFLVIFYNNPANPQQATDTQLVWRANYYNYLYDSAGSVTDSVWVGSDSLLVLDYYSYYVPFDVIEKYELGRVITPYGGNLENDWYFRYTFDVTDFVHLLKDSVELRAFYGGWSSGFSVTLDFDFIEGIPPRNVISIENLYQGSWSYTNANDFNSNYLPVKQVSLDANTKGAKLRMTPTGHGFDNDLYAAEFYPVNYKLKLNGTQTHQQLVWRDDCGDNPIYPKDETSGAGYSHTWLYDRANWCPGLRAWTYEHEITSSISAGSNVDVNIEFDDYSWSGTQTPSYIIQSQLVQYGDINFSLDAEMMDIIAPNNDKNFQRLNPICRNPVVIIRNRGASTLTSLDIKYGVEGYTSHTYNWTGSLGFLEQDTVALYHIDFTGAQQNPVFFAEVSNPNGGNDEYTVNDIKRSAFDIPPVYTSNFCIWFQTNASGSESVYELTDGEGVPIFTRSNMSSNTYYKDTFELDTGCYILKVYDAGGDGLSFPYNSDGTGSVKIRNLEDDGPLFLVNFNPNFGNSITHYFSVGYTVGIKEINELNNKLNIYPNPFDDAVNIVFDNPNNEPYEIELFNLMGHRLRTVKNVTSGHHILNKESLEPGVYFIVLTGAGKSISGKLMIK